MQKAGLTREGCLRQQMPTGAAYEDLVYYGLLREEYESLRRGTV